MKRIYYLYIFLFVVLLLFLLLLGFNYSSFLLSYEESFTSSELNQFLFHIKNIEDIMTIKYKDIYDQKDNTIANIQTSSDGLSNSYSNFAKSYCSNIYDPLNPTDCIFVPSRTIIKSGKDYKKQIIDIYKSNTKISEKDKRIIKESLDYIDTFLDNFIKNRTNFTYSEFIKFIQEHLGKHQFYMSNYRSIFKDIHNRMANDPDNIMFSQLFGRTNCSNNNDVKSKIECDITPPKKLLEKNKGYIKEARTIIKESDGISSRTKEDMNKYLDSVSNFFSKISSNHTEKEKKEVKKPDTKRITNDTKFTCPELNRFIQENLGKYGSFINKYRNILKDINNKILNDPENSEFLLKISKSNCSNNYDMNSKMESDVTPSQKLLEKNKKYMAEARNIIYNSPGISSQDKTDMYKLLDAVNDFFDKMSN